MKTKNKGKTGTCVVCGKRTKAIDWRRGRIVSACKKHKGADATIVLMPTIARKGR